MPEGKPYDVVVIGAGIAGAALAAAITNQGLRIALVEAAPLGRQALPSTIDLASFDPRVSALTPRSREFLERLEAWQSVANYRHLPYRHMTVWDAEGTGRIEFDCAEVDAAALGHIVENRAIVDALLARVAESADVTLFNPARLESFEREAGGSMQILLDNGESLATSLIVAADGALSRVRDMAGFNTREWDYGHRAIVATVEVEASHQHTAWQRFLSSGPLALLPLPGDQGRHYCSIVWSLEEDLVEDLLRQDDSGFCRELEAASERCLGAVLACSARGAFPLRQRHAVDYVQPGIALVADAAHTIHPLAGQGINLGLQDVDVLAQEILAGAKRGVGPGDIELLRRYQRRRKSENLLMMAAMDGFKRLFEQQALPVRWLRNVGMRGLGQLAPLKQQIIRHAMGIT